MSVSTTTIPTTGPDPDLGDVVRVWWRLRAWIILGLVFGFLGAIVFSALAVPHYRVSMLVAPATHGLDPKPKAAHGDLASTAGEDSTDFFRFENIVRGGDVAAQLMTDDVMRGVAMDRPLRILSGSDLKTATELTDWMARNVRIEPVGTTPMRRLVIHHADAQWAMAFLTRLYTVTDTLIRNDVRVQADARVDYLQNTLGQARNPDHRRVLTDLLIEQEQIRMMLAMDEPFAAVVAERASASSRPVWPRKSLVFPAFMIGGAILFYGLGLIFWRKS